jgi:ABC-type bacteriocin/lantibiotic exporter with double-glycine peptidase domain
VPLVAQVNDTACWAASLQMILTYSRKQSVDQNAIAKAVGFTLDDLYGWTELQKAFDYWEFCVKPAASFLPKGWRVLLKEHGPLWVVQRSGENITHAVVLTGMSEDEENPTMFVNDPWPPGEGKVSYVNFTEFEKIFEEVEVEHPRYVLQILYYCGGTFRAPHGE